MEPFRRLLVVIAALVTAGALAGLSGAACGTRPSAISDREIGAPHPGSGATGVASARNGALVFACLGDVRPAIEDDVAGYPTNVVASLFQRIEALRPRAAFAVGTGDYMFASTRLPSSSAAQIDLFLAARALYAGPFFPALGNHECTGATASNCGPEGAEGTTANYTAFVERLLPPQGDSGPAVEPYYSVQIAGLAGDAAGPSSAKVVFIAANAWSMAQAEWLERALAAPTTYTFVVRHEPARVVDAPGVAPSEDILARHPYTLALVGHSHTYGHYADAPHEVVVGNGGAPLESKDYGFALLQQRDDGAVAVDMVNWRTGGVDPQFHFAVRADGSAAPP